MAEERYISLKPSDAVHGGGMVPEGPYEIADAKFTMWDYNGTVASPVPALGIEYKADDGSLHAQYYSAGDSRNLEPTEDHTRLRAKGTAQGLNDSTNCFALLRSLVNAGFSEDKLGHDISVIVGARVEVMHETAPEREIGGRKVEKKLIAVIHKVLALPGEKKKTEKTAAKKTNGSELPLERWPAERLAKATGVIKGVLKKGGGQMEKKAVSTAIFQTMPATDPDRGDILNLLVNDSFLSSLTDDGVLYDSSSGTVLYVGG